MASKKVNQPSTKKAVKKSAAKKSPKKAKRQSVSSQANGPVKYIPPVPPLPEADLKKMENARSRFTGSPGDSYETEKKKRSEKESIDRKEALTKEANNIFDKHQNICSKVFELVGGITSLANQAAEIYELTKNTDLRNYSINRRLNFDSLVKDLRVASTRLRQVTTTSETLNKIHRDFVASDINSEKPAFE